MFAVGNAMLSELFIDVAEVFLGELAGEEVGCVVCRAEA